MWRAGDPSFLWLFILLAAATWHVFRRRAGTGTGTVYPPTGHLSRLPRSVRHVLVDLSRIAFVAGAALLILALARPQRLESHVEETTESIAIFMVADISGSMAGLDFASADAIRAGDHFTRLDAVKDVFSEFVRQRPHDAIGLITFGGYAVTRVPLTFDHNLLQHVIDDVTLSGYENQRTEFLQDPAERMTAIGDALALACARLEETEIPSRVVVLLSDGESNYGIIDPDKAIRIAVAHGIRVHTIAVGSEGPVPFLDYDPLGRPLIRQAVIGLDTELLRRMADTTAGHYFHVTDPEGMEAAINAIDDLETTTIEHRLREHYTEDHGWLLGLGLLLLILAVTVRCGVSGELI